MKILLLQNVSGLGSAGQTKQVKPGYATNYLLPNKLATTDLTAKVTSPKAKLSEVEINQFLKRISSKRLTITKKASEKGTLFSGLTSGDIKKALLKKAKSLAKVDFKVIVSKQIKKVGDHEVEIGLKNKRSKLKVTVVADEEIKSKKPAKKAKTKKK